LWARPIRVARKTDFLFPSVFLNPRDTRRQWTMEFEAGQCRMRVIEPFFSTAGTAVRRDYLVEPFDSNLQLPSPDSE
jgi:hypothetical protein